MSDGEEPAEEVGESSSLHGEQEVEVLDEEDLLADDGVLKGVG